MAENEKVLGLDMGTNSIGWAYIDKGSKRILGTGIVLFHDSRTKTSADLIGESGAVARREARMARRQRDRKKYSYESTAKFLCKVLDIAQIDLTLNPYQMRAEAAEGEVSPYTLARALLHLRKRRGFASNRKSGKGEEGGKFENSHKALEKLLIARKLTLGQFLAEERESGTVRFRFNEEFGNKDYYPLRSMYEKEFAVIREANQSAMSDCDWNRLHDLIFYQRPLRPQIVGDCQFYEDEKRASKHLPTTHEFRIRQKLQNLRVIGGKEELSDDEFQKLWDKLQTQKSYTYSAMRKDLGLPKIKNFNMESKKEKGIEGNSPMAEIVKIAQDLGTPVPSLHRHDWDEIIIKALKTDDDEDFLNDVKSYTLLSKDFAQKIKNWADGQSASYGSVSLKFMRDILPHMEAGLPYHKAITKLENKSGQKLHHSNFDSNGKKPEYLPYYGEIIEKSTQKQKPFDSDTKKRFMKANNERAIDENQYGRIANPTVHVALNQLVKLVNGLVKEHGWPDKIHIELARDLKNGKNKREEIDKEIAEATEKRKELKKTYRQHTGNDRFSRADYQKILFWEELSENSNGIVRSCLYCGNPISPEQIFSHETEVDHILPYSWSYDNTKANKTVVHASCNRKKGDSTPHEQFGEECYQRAEAAGLKSSKLWRFEEAARERFERKKKRLLSEEEIERCGGDEDAAWAARQMTDTQYISRTARTILSKTTGSIHKVIPFAGQLTANLRYQWRIWEKLGRGNQKTREDHRHHAVDAFVLAMGSLRMVQEAARQNAREEKSSESLGDYYLPSWAIEQFRERFDTIIIHEKPDHGTQGAMFKETAYGQKITDEEQKDGYNAVSRTTLQAYVQDRKNKQKKGNQPDRKQRSLIRDPILRTKIDNLIRQNNHLGPKDLCEYIHKQTGVRRLRMIMVKNLVAIPSASYKAYERGAFCAVNIWKVPQSKGGKFTGKNKYIGIYIPYDIAKKHMKQLTRDKSDDPILKDFAKPHPEAHLVMRLYKKDMVALRDEDGELAKKLEATSNSDTTIKPVSIDGEDYIIATIDSFSTTNNTVFISHQYAAKPKPHMIAITTLIGKHRMRKLSVLPTGAYSLHKFWG